MTLRLASGEVVAGRYHLEKLLGQGGMGSVWQAVHTVTRRTVALKFIRRLHDARPEMRRRFLREARAASAVDHPNVVGVQDLFELEDGTPVMVIEHLDGETLAARIAREGALSIAVTAALLLPVVSAVGTAHALGIVHRDLKPENVFVARRKGGGSEVKVLDFGIAKLIDDPPGPEPDTTQTGAPLGTPAYMAPEQAFGERDADHRADVWALGVVLYECLSGVRPIEGENAGQLLKRLLSAAITPIEHVAPDVPSDVAVLVGRMLSRERALRPGDLREAAVVLARYTDVAVPAFGAAGSDAARASRLVADGARDHRPSPPGPGPARSPLVVAPLMVAAAVAALGAAVLAATHGSDPGVAAGASSTSPPATDTAPVSARAPAAVPTQPASAEPAIGGVAVPAGSAPGVPPRVARRVAAGASDAEPPAAIPPAPAATPRSSRGLIERPPF